MNHYYFKISTYEQYKMDLLMAEHIQRRLQNQENQENKLIENPISDSTELTIYQSPKRDNMCPQCGQQLQWCVCHLNDK